MLSSFLKFVYPASCSYCFSDLEKFNHVLCKECFETIELSKEKHVVFDSLSHGRALYDFYEKRKGPYRELFKSFLVLKYYHLEAQDFDFISCFTPLESKLTSDVSQSLEKLVKAFARAIDIPFIRAYKQSIFKASVQKDTIVEEFSLKKKWSHKKGLIILKSPLEKENQKITKFETIYLFGSGF